jgi:hypothetical protein
MLRIQQGYFKQLGFGRRFRLKTQLYTSRVRGHGAGFRDMQSLHDVVRAATSSIIGPGWTKRPRWEDETAGCCARARCSRVARRRRAPRPRIGSVRFCRGGGGGVSLGSICPDCRRGETLRGGTGGADRERGILRARASTRQTRVNKRQSIYTTTHQQTEMRFHLCFVQV